MRVNASANTCHSICTSAFQVCREADGFQRSLVSPEAGLRRLVHDSVETVLIPVDTAVRRVHQVLMEASRYCHTALHSSVLPLHWGCAWSAVFKSMNAFWGAEHHQSRLAHATGSAMQLQTVLLMSLLSCWHAVSLVSRA